MGGEVSSLVKRAKANDEELGALQFAGEAALSSEAISAIAKSLSENTHVRVLDFEGHPAAGVAKGGAKELGNMLKTNRGLNLLRLSKTALGDSGAEALAVGLVNQPTLKVLDVRSADIGVAGIKALLKAVAQNQSLEELRLDDNPGLAGAVEELVAALAANKSIKTLGLGGATAGAAASSSAASKLGVSEAERIASAVQQHASGNGVQLSLLDLSHNGLGDAGVSALASLIASPAAPLKLSLASNGVSSTGGAAVLSAQKNAQSKCQQIDLGGNTDISGAVLSEAHELFLARAKEAREKRAKAMGLDD